MPSLILASASPRRVSLLTQLGLSFSVVPSQIAEDVLEGETPESHVHRLSLEKVREVAADHPQALVLAGDTVVVLDGRILGKPRSEEEAVSMLLSLSGRTHTVLSGLALASPGREAQAAVGATEVTFSPFVEEVARAYVETGEPLDKAGAYGIQGLGCTLVAGIRGDYHTVVGLPVPILLELLEAGGWKYEFGELVPMEKESGS